MTARDYSDSIHQGDGIETLQDLLEVSARNHAQSGIYFASGPNPGERDFLCYSDLYDTAKRILESLQALLPTAGTHVVLLLDNASDIIPVVWACILGGYPACPLIPVRHDPARFAEQLSRLNSLLDKPLFVVEANLRQGLPSALQALSIAQLQSGAPAEPRHQSSPTDLALTFLTSGSTGNSKAVALTNATVMASLRGKNSVRQLSSKDIQLNWSSLDHVIALIEGHLLPLYVGAVQVQVSPRVVIADPLVFLRLISSFRINTSFTPNFLLGQIVHRLESANAGERDKIVANLDLSCVRHIISGGEANPVSTGTRFLELLAPSGLSRDALWPVWGMTETCAAAVYSRDFPLRDAGNAFAAVGFAMPGLEMRLGSDDGGELPGGSTGELQVCGGPVFDRYYNSPEVTRAAFTHDGWFHTGDLARIEEGRLTLLGRSKDCIIVSGVNYFSQDLEAELEKLAGVAHSFVAAFPTRKDGADTEQLVIAFAPAFAIEEEARLLKLCLSIRDTATVVWGFRPAVIIPLAHTDFPKTNLGKIQRSLMRRRFEAGDYAPNLANIVKLNEKLSAPYTAPQDAVEQDLVQLFAELFEVTAARISATANFFDLGGTSIDILRLTRMLHSKFGLDATLTTVIQHQTIRQLAREISLGIKSDSQYSPIVDLQVKGSSAPLFLVHPGDGGVLVFVSIAKHFADERPVYALRAPGFDSGESCFDSFEEIVRSYTGAIRARQPKGPYILAGYSMGGSIAFEIAKSLVDSGERVTFLGCIDGQPCGTETDADFAATLQGAAALLNLVDTRHLSSWARVASSLHAAGRNYVMSGKVDSMVIFESDGLAPGGGGNANWSTRLRAWNSYVVHPKYVRVSGDHNSMLSPVHSMGFQATLREEIHAAELSCLSSEQSGVLA